MTSRDCPYRLSVSVVFPSGAIVFILIMFWSESLDVLIYLLAWNVVLMNWSIKVARNLPLKC
jgi:hypothetical protein